jgi:hypothetical protein
MPAACRKGNDVSPSGEAGPPSPPSRTKAQPRSPWVEGPVTRNVLFIGHSLQDHIGEMVAALAEHHPEVTLTYQESILPGASLKDHFNKSAGFEGLRRGDFDNIVVTNSVPSTEELDANRNPIYPPLRKNFRWTEFPEHLLRYHRLAVAGRPDAQLWLYVVWPPFMDGKQHKFPGAWRQAVSTYQEEWRDALETSDEELRRDSKAGAFKSTRVIPGAQAIVALTLAAEQGKLPGISGMADLFEDGIHINNLGRYFIACLQFAAITGKSPEGLPSALFKKQGEAILPAPSPEAGRVMQTIARQFTEQAG